MQEKHKEKMYSEKRIHRKLDYMFTYSLDWILFVGYDGVVLDSNDRVKDFIGLDKESIIGKNISFLENSFEYIDKHEDARKLLKQKHFIREFKPKNQPNIYRQSIIDQVDNEGYLVTIRDISDRKLFENSEAKRIKTTRALLNSTIQSAVLIDSDGYIIEINNNLLILLGKTYGEMIGKNIKSIISSNLPSMVEIYKNAVKTKKPIRYEHEQESRWFSILVYPIVDENSPNAYQVSIFFEDITERKNIEQQLIQHKNNLEGLVKDRTLELQEVNTTLKVLLREREKDKEALEQKIVYNLKELVFPALEKVKYSTQKDARITNLLDVIEDNLNEIISPFSQKLSSRYFNFTPTELNIANMIKHGKTTKEISEILFMAYNTVEFHRANIRKKLGISNEKANLRTQLQLIDE
jgi:PAS domain S-box-containing protein